MKKEWVKKQIQQKIKDAGEIFFENGAEWMEASAFISELNKIVNKYCGVVTPAKPNNKKE